MSKKQGVCVYRVIEYLEDQGHIGPCTACSSNSLDMRGRYTIGFKIFNYTEGLSTQRGLVYAKQLRKNRIFSFLEGRMFGIHINYIRKFQFSVFVPGGSCSLVTRLFSMI